MSTVNTTGQALQAGETQIETDIAALGTAITTEIADATAQIQNALNSAGVPTQVVADVTAKLAALHTTVTGLTAQVVKGDPGPLPPAPGA